MAGDGDDSVWKAVTVYFNENDPYPAQWLRNLWPEATVDERSIVDVQAVEVSRFTRCHFFGGIGGWEYAIALAGWPDDREVWTGSCPCQPFSQAGRAQGLGDERHLWPAFRRLIAECSPPVIFGEQVASRAGREWLSGIRVDLEDLGYAVGAADLCAASVGAPHIRQRLWWVAESTSEQRDRSRNAGRGRGEPANGGADGGMGNSIGDRAERSGRSECLSNAASEIDRLDDSASNGRQYDEEIRGGDGAGTDTTRTGLKSGAGCESRGMADAYRTSDNGRAPGREQSVRDERCEVDRLGQSDRSGPLAGSSAASPAGYWHSSESTSCLDGKQRRTEPGVRPLAHGVPSRVGRLRAYGNAIVPQVAAVFVRAFMEAETIAVPLGKR